MLDLGHPQRAQARDRFAALLGQRDARRRLSLRSSDRRWRADDGEFSAQSNFLASLEQDPVLSRVKLIAEPWDLGHGGYHVGDFPAGWSEWNDRFRDGVRRFWRGDGSMPEMATRLTGSSDIFDRRGRRPRASVNFVTAHDGFTLDDLVSYDRKHNEANLEENRDGSRRELQLELRRRGADRRSATSSPCASARSATFLPCFCSRKACRCCWPATSLATPSSETTTRTAKTTNVIVARAAATSLGPRTLRLLEFVRLADRHSAHASGLSATALLSRR